MRLQANGLAERIYWRRLRSHGLLAGGLVVSIMLGGCHSTVQPESYRLPTATAKQVTSQHVAYTHVVWLAPIMVSSAIDQPGLAWRRNDVQMQVMREHQWAEPLPEALTMAIAPQLEEQLPGWRVSLTPEGTNETLSIFVTAFNAGPEHNVEVAGRWHLVAENGQVSDGSFEETQQLSGAGWDGVVRSLGQTWSLVAERLAEGIAQTAP